MNAMIETIQDYMKKGEDLVLALITETEGSAPRGKGAAMLVGREGLLAGTIGGGALEGTVLRTAQQCLNEKRSDALFYSLQGADGTEDGMICGGTVSVTMRWLSAVTPSAVIWIG